MYTFIGFDKFTSSKTEKLYAKLYFVNENGAGIGDSCFDEIMELKDDSFYNFLYDTVGCHVRINYNKGYSGKAYISSIEKI